MNSNQTTQFGTFTFGYAKTQEINNCGNLEVWNQTIFTLCLNQM